MNMCCWGSQGHHPPQAATDPLETGRDGARRGTTEHDGVRRGATGQTGRDGSRRVATERDGARRRRRLRRATQRRAAITNASDVHRPTLALNACHPSKLSSSLSIWPLCHLSKFTYKQPRLDWPEV